MSNFKETWIFSVKATETLAVLMLLLQKAKKFVHFSAAVFNLQKSLDNILIDAVP